MSLSDYIQNLLNGINSINNENIELLAQEIKKRINTNKQIYLIGNGGSAANGFHIAGDYLKSLILLKKRINIKCLSDNGCYLTAAANDLDYSQIYEILVGTLIQKDDLIIFLSGSGNSMNLIKACRKALKFGIKTFAITGYSGGELSKLVNNNIHANIDDMELAEDIQMIIMHYIKQKLINEFKKEYVNKEFQESTKYKKRTELGEIA